VTEFPRKPAQPATPSNDPPPANATRPAAEHRSTARPDPKPAQPKVSRRDAAKFIANVEQRKRGHTTFFSPADRMQIALHPGDAGYSPPTSWEAAFAAECEAWKLEPDVVRYALKFWGYKLPG